MRELGPNDEKSIRDFCAQKHVELLDVVLTHENEVTERAYIFSDNLGHYTIKGIRESLSS